MNELMVVKDVRGYIDDQDTAWIHIEDAARGLGFLDVKNGVEYVRWNRVHSYLNEFGFSPLVANPDLIPEWVFWRLAMKANNAAAVAFQDRVAREIIPAIRKTGSYSPGIPKDYKEAMLEAVRQFELKEIAERKLLEAKSIITVAAPKAKAYDDFMSTEGLFKVREVAKILRMCPVVNGRLGKPLGIELMNKLLRERGTFEKKNKDLVPLQVHIDRGRFVTRESEFIDPKEHSHIRTKTFVTKKGLRWIYDGLTLLGYKSRLGDSVYDLFGKGITETAYLPLN